MQNYKMVSANASVYMPIKIFKVGNAYYSAYAIADTNEQIKEFVNKLFEDYENGIVALRKQTIAPALVEEKNTPRTNTGMSIVNTARPVQNGTSPTVALNAITFISSSTAPLSFVLQSHDDHKYITLLSLS